MLGGEGEVAVWIRLKRFWDDFRSGDNIEAGLGEVGEEVVVSLLSFVLGLGIVTE